MTGFSPPALTLGNGGKNIFDGRDRQALDKRPSGRVHQPHIGIGWYFEIQRSSLSSTG